uniref:TNFR-Cys domain-containing protein n=1 Tax=Fundulus heteroclitus TaxID=8078 RepID=A0A3Q2Q3U0_FUNHE
MLLMRASRVHTLRCHLMEYRIGNECCPMCPPGSHVKSDCTAFRSTSCLPCRAGTYMDLPNGQKECTPCSACDSAGLKEKDGCTLSSDAVCEPMEGFFCTQPKSGGCGAAQKHRSCEPGQYISKMGTASADADCSDCISGTFSNGTTSLLKTARTQRDVYPSVYLNARLCCFRCEHENLQLIKAGTAGGTVSWQGHWSREEFGRKKGKIIINNPSINLAMDGFSVRIP